MQPGWLVAIEVLLVLAVVLGFGLRELWMLKRDRALRERPPGEPPADDRG
jgi:hypothetical protein